MKLKLLVVILSVVVSSLADKETKAEQQKHNKIQPRLFGLSSATTTYTDVVLATVTVFSSCISSIAAAVCSKKKKKRSADSAPIMVEDSPSETYDLS